MELRHKPRSKESTMKKILALTLVLAGCESVPVYDLKTTKDPANIVENEMECQYLADKSAVFIWGKFPAYLNCLEGRGVTIINRSK